MQQNVIDRLKVLFPKEEPEVIVEAMLSFLEGNKMALQMISTQMDKHIKAVKAKNGKL